VTDEIAIRVEQDGPIMTVTMDRPDVLNALDPPSHRKLSEAFDRYATDDDLRVAIITGAGETAFCVGSDLKVRAELGQDDMPATGFAGLTERFDLLKPVIAAVNGHAIGGGLEIVLACDMAIAVPHAKFGLPEVKVGLAAYGGLHRLVRQLPMKHAMEIALTGTLFDAVQAMIFDLINRVVEPGKLSESVISLATGLLDCAPLSLRASKQMMVDGLAEPSLQAAFSARYSAYETMHASDDAKEGSRAFLENRKPVWKNR
jgi:enoyl-CoA hydratase/carnithine racemase